MTRTLKRTHTHVWYIIGTKAWMDATTSSYKNLKEYRNPVVLRWIYNTCMSHSRPWKRNWLDAATSSYNNLKIKKKFGNVAINVAHVWKFVHTKTKPKETSLDVVSLSYKNLKKYKYLGSAAICVARAYLMQKKTKTMKTSANAITYL